MDDKNLILSLAEHADLRLRSIGREDIENLRIWKNRHQGSFFLNRDILPGEQEKWFAAFENRGDDFMFVVEQEETSEGDWRSIGCLGFRKLTDEACVDAYNIMRGEKGAHPASFTMSDAFRAMLAFAASKYEDLPIRCKVLCNNPAVEWYKKNDFSIIENVNDEYYLMELDKASLVGCDVIIKDTK
jgi:hypothetical protein